MSPAHVAALALLTAGLAALVVGAVALVRSPSRWTAWPNRAGAAGAALLGAGQAIIAVTDGDAGNAAVATVFAILFGVHMTMLARLPEGPPRREA